VTKEEKAEYNKQYRIRNKERLSAYHKEYHQKNAKRKTEATRKWLNANKDKARAWVVSNHARYRWDNLKSKYGLTRQQYEDMVTAQSGLCLICSQPPNGKRGLVVDHCHATGRIRGLLCNRCNIRLGVVELGEWVTLAQAYLKR
jgi:hypothetical protein